jgi:hypothetical protein
MSRALRARLVEIGRFAPVLWLSGHKEAGLLKTQ